MSNENIEKWSTLKEVQEYLGVGRETILQWIPKTADLDLHALSLALSEQFQIIIHDVMKDIRSSIDSRIMYHIEDFYDPHSNYDYRSRLLYRIQEDLFMAEDLGALEFEDWHTCMCIVWYMGSAYDMEERLS